MKDNIKIRTLEEVGVIIIGGQIMTRITAKEGSADEVVETRRVVIPKCISGDGSIRSEEMPEEALNAGSQATDRAGRHCREALYAV